VSHFILFSALLFFRLYTLIVVSFYPLPHPWKKQKLFHHPWQLCWDLSTQHSHTLGAGVEMSLTSLRLEISIQLTVFLSMTFWLLISTSPEYSFFSRRCIQMLINSKLIHGPGLEMRKYFNEWPVLFKINILSRLLAADTFHYIWLEIVNSLF